MAEAKSNEKSNLWFWLIGFLAFAWFILRTGSNPKRLSYPCQQAAFPLASSWLLAVIAFFAGSILLRRYAQLSGFVMGLIGVVYLITSLPLTVNAEIQSLESLPVWESYNPVSNIFVMDNIPLTTGSLAPGNASVPDEYLSDPAMDTLLLMMEKKGIYLHKTIDRADGIVGAEDVVIIKGNFQWTSRNTTNTDRIKGLIWQIVNHPDGFTGEILICDNTQDVGTRINQNDNNSEDEEQSIIDVANTFLAKGYPVYILDWTDLWSRDADEYSEGDNNDGYVYEEATKISYPKFTTPSDRNLISLRYGIWNSAAQSYDPSKLCIIDFPVLKAHSLAGATIAVKNWIGVSTTADNYARYGGWNEMHDDYFFGEFALIAKIMAVTYPRLSIVDAAYTSRQDPNILVYQKTDMLLASTDPVAVSWYAAKYILTPIALVPQHSDPDDRDSDYSINLTCWMNNLQQSGYSCTKNPDAISVYDRGILSLSSTDQDEIKTVPENFRLYQNYPNPFNPVTAIKYDLIERNHVKIKVMDMLGREITTLVNAIMPAGSYSVHFDGGNLPSGIYFYRMLTDSNVDTKKMILMK